MAEEAALATMADPVKSPTLGDGDAVLTPRKQRRMGVVSRLWRGIFGADDDFQKKLEHLSKAEASVLARLKRRARSSKKVAKNIIYLSVVFEVVAVSYAVAITRSKDLAWKTRAIYVLPMFVLPFLSTAIYKGLLRFTRMLNSKDEKTLEWLRAERQAKIDELKEKTNYYTTQQLIQRYDLDPAAKAAAASVLASKLGSDTGLKVRLGDEYIRSTSAKSYDVDLVQSTGLRNRKSSHARGHSAGSSITSEIIDETFNELVATAQEIASPNERVVQHFKGSIFGDGGWLARLAALLVGEDPTQCYALICSHCHMHNGLAKKEDFSYITYYCPHCHALNGSRRLEEPEISSSYEKDTPTSSLDCDNIFRSETNTNSNSRIVSASSSTAAEESAQGTEESEINKHACGSPASD
ncbi:hypothetical protein Cni_G03518 [Canna indica]|uniref:Lunapark zinc ribbon domain-containing protein n=1 Tax=Canna indica TaxID=4628 RepID=A0AAQ3JSL3_9LILI|nr:hypothetical protein Cni_G03518 [Canna indica]